jgi:CubicO group peptidase (beta-lactamase class C family)
VKQFLAVSLACAAVAFGAEVAVWKPTTRVSLISKPNSVLRSATLADRIDAYVRPFVAGGNFCGTILVAHGAATDFLKGYGMADTEHGVPNTSQTMFHIASITKTFTAAAILLLVERRVLSLDDRLSKFIPDFPRGKDITIHQLLSHTSGIKNFFEIARFNAISRNRQTLPELIAIFKNEPLDFEPGTAFHYSNSNYALLAYITERASGQTFRVFLEKNVFAPLGLRDTVQPNGDGSIAGRAQGYTPVGAAGIERATPLDPSIEIGSGSIDSTVGDLLAWDRALHSSRLLSADSRRKMFTPYKHEMGYGWFIRKRRNHDAIDVNGSLPGFTSSLTHFVAEDLVVIVLSNNESMLSSELADGIAALALGEEPARPQVVSPKADPHMAAQLAGRYQFGEEFYYSPRLLATVEIDDEGRLRMDVKASTPSYLYLQPNGDFLDRLFGGRVSFVHNPDGTVKTLLWNVGTTFSGERVRE